MSDQKAMNRQTWAALQDAGFVPGSDLEVETFSVTRDEASASALAEDLRARGWRTELSTTEPKGLFRKKVEWIVVGLRRLAGVQMEDLDAMVDELESLAAAHGGTFDGWGAGVPS